AVLAIAGTPAFSGYYSKDMILAHAGAFGYFATHGPVHHEKYYWLLFALPATIAYVTAFYMTRCWMLTFWGKPRNQHLFDHAHETPILYGPLIVLAVLSVIGGRFVGVREMLESAVKEGSQLCRAMPGGKDFHGYAQAWPAEPIEGENRAVEHAP